MGLKIDAQQQGSGGGGDVITYDLIAGASDWVAVIGEKAVLCLEPMECGDGGTVCSSLGCCCALCAVGGGDGDTLSQGTHNGGGCDGLRCCGCCLHVVQSVKGLFDVGFLIFSNGL